MNRFIIVLFLFSYNFSVTAQDDSFSISFLESLVREKQPEGKIFYTDRISKTDVNKIKSWLSKSFIVGISDETKGNSITLTKQEKKYILQQFEIYSNSYWTENLFPNSSLVKQEDKLTSIKKIFQDYSENLNNPNNNEETKMELLKSYQRPNVFSFSKPVFIRNNSLLIIFTSSACGDPCGRDELSFYKIENNVWKKFILVNSNDF